MFRGFTAKTPAAARHGPYHGQGPSRKAGNSPPVVPAVTGRSAPGFIKLKTEEGESMWQEILIAIISGLISAGGVSTFIKFGLTRMYNKVDSLEKDIATLEKERISKLEKDLTTDVSNLEEDFKKALKDLGKDLKDHVKEDRSQEILTEIKALKGRTIQDGVKMDNFSAEQSRQAQAIKNVDDYMRGLHTEIKELRDDMKEIFKK
jgi:hypothetical protein